MGRYDGLLPSPRQPDGLETSDLLSPRTARTRLVPAEPTGVLRTNRTT
ncbi:hypothetical protein GCM10009738_83980 [Kitasatospora viridis]|uniref:Uncharacterized protein n=1 Tax=Kitasatospora viridis TaxID=281105 RepID=A0A561UC03_9ACTN|nr:hypothetical protein FHX73_11643 [Kitasatospora viridis]